MMPFVAAIIWHYDMFGILADGAIFRAWNAGEFVVLQKLLGDEDEYAPPIRVLRAMRAAR